MRRLMMTAALLLAIPVPAMAQGFGGTGGPDRYCQGDNCPPDISRNGPGDQTRRPRDDRGDRDDRHGRGDRDDRHDRDDRSDRDDRRDRDDRWDRDRDRRDDRWDRDRDDRADRDRDRDRDRRDRADRDRDRDRDRRWRRDRRGDTFDDWRNDRQGWWNAPPQPRVQQLSPRQISRIRPRAPRGTTYAAYRGRLVLVDLRSGRIVETYGRLAALGL